MSICKLRVKSPVLEAVQWRGPEDNALVIEFCGSAVAVAGSHVAVNTIEGTRKVHPTNWIVRSQWKDGPTYQVASHESLHDQFERIPN